MAYCLPPPSHFSAPPNFFDMIANFYVDSLCPPAKQGEVNIRLPTPENWIDHQSVIYKVQRYLLSKSHHIRVNPDGKWYIYDNNGSTEIECLLQWCYLARRFGPFRADDIMLRKIPFTFIEKVEKVILGVVGPNQHLSLGLSGFGDIGRQCTFLSEYTGSRFDIFKIFQRLGTYRPAISTSEYDLRVYLFRLGNTLTIDSLQSSYNKWHPGVRHFSDSSLTSLSSLPQSLPPHQTP